MYALYAIVVVPGWIFAADLLMIVDPRLVWLFLLLIHITWRITSAVFVARAISSAESIEGFRFRAILGRGRFMPRCGGIFSMTLMETAPAR